MKITIDTKEDSPEDIEKVIKLLHDLRGASSNVNIFDQPTEQASSGFMNMFGSSDSVPPQKSDTNTQKKEDTPLTQVMQY